MPEVISEDLEVALKVRRKGFGLSCGENVCLWDLNFERDLVGKGIRNMIQLLLCLSRKFSPTDAWT